MKQELLICSLLFSSVFGAAQIPNPGAVRVSVPTTPQTDSKAVQPNVEPPRPAIEAARQVAPVNSITAISTIEYPPGQGSEFGLSIPGLQVGAGGYFYPTQQDNQFAMRVPPMLTASPISLNCIIIGRLNGTSRIYWSFASGHIGGGGSINFPVGSAQTSYSIEHGDFSANPLKSVWFSVPIGAAIKSCSVTGAFDRTRK